MGKEQNQDINIWHPGQGPLPAPPEPIKPTSLLSDSTHAAISDSSYNFMKTFIDGLNQLSVIPAILFDGTIRSTFSQALTRNLSYLALAIASSYLEDYSKKYSDDYVPHPDIVNTALTVGFLTVNTFIFTRFLISSTVDNMSIAAAVRKQKLPHLDKHTCQCDMNLSIPAVLNDPLTNFFGAIRAMNLSLIPIVGQPAMVVYGGIFYGSGLIHLRLSQCLSHRRAYVKDHVFSVMGYGASFLALTQLFYTLLKKYSGANNFIVYDAIFTMMYQMYIVHSLTAGLDFPQDAITFDPSYLDNRAVQAYLSDLEPIIKKTLSGKKPGWFPADKALELLHSKSIRYWTRLDIRSLERFLQNPSNKLWVKMNQPMLMTVLDELAAIPDNQGVKIGKRLEKWLGLMGIEIEQLNLARTVWNLSQEGYFSTEFLEGIRKAINKVAGVTPELCRAQTSKQTRVEVVLKEAQAVVVHDDTGSASNAAAATKSRRRVAVLSQDGIQVNDDYVQGRTETEPPNRTVYHQQPQAVRRTADGKKVYAKTIDHTNRSAGPSAGPSAGQTKSRSPSGPF